jgi:hypothetical protein
VTFKAATDYVARCFSEYGLATDDSGYYAALYRPFHPIGLELGVSVAHAALRGEAREPPPISGPTWSRRPNGISAPGRSWTGRAATPCTAASCRQRTPWPGGSAPRPRPRDRAPQRGDEGAGGQVVGCLDRRGPGDPQATPRDGGMAASGRRRAQRSRLGTGALERLKPRPDGHAKPIRSLPALWW